MSQANSAGNYNDPHNQDGDEEEQELNEEQIVEVIIQLGNDILRNLGVEDPIDDVAVFFSDEFYIQFFQAAFPEIDFSQLTGGQNVEEMAENIQALIDLLGEQILKYDLSHIKGNEIVSGNPEHCINLLQLVLEISEMIKHKGGVGNAVNSGPASPSQALGSSGGIVDKHPEDQDEYEEEAEHQSPVGEVGAPAPQQQRQFDLEGDDQDFDEDDFDPNNHQQLHDDEGMEDDDELEQQFMQQLNHGGPAIQNPGHHLHGDSGEEPMDEDDLKMYEQFLAANNKQQQDLLQKNPNLSNNLGGPSSNAGGLSGLEQQLAQMEEDEEGDEDHHHHQEGHDGEDNEEINLDDIDIEQLDPQILQIAEQMGVHPTEVLKQIMKMNNGEMEEDDEDGHNMHDDDEDVYGDEMDIGNNFQQPGQDDSHAREEQLRREKELFKQQMGLAPSSDKKSAGSKIQQPPSKPQQQQQIQNHQFDHEDDYGQDDDESYYSENEIKTRIKLISQKSYSAPYIIISDCYPEPLCDDENDDEDGSQLPSKAYSTTVLQSVELQQHLEQQMQQNQDDGAGTAGLLQQQQAKIMGRQHHAQDEDDEEEELDVDISKKLLELQQQQQQQHKGSSNKAKQRIENHQQHEEDEEDGEDEGEEDDEMMIDLDQLDDHNREILLEYLRQEYDKNPSQFPFSKELIEDFMQKEQMNKLAKMNGQEIESVKDINSQEMVLEEAGAGSTEQHKIVGGGQQIEDEEHELHEEDEEGAEYLVPQGKNNMQVEYRDNDGGIIDLQQQQHHMAMMQQQQLAMMQQAANLQGSKKKGKKGSKTGKRPKSAGKKKAQQVQMNIVGHQVQQQVIPEEDDEEQTQQIQQIPEDQLQQIIQLLQEQQVDLENLDPNFLQQILLAQQQQSQLPAQVLAAQSQPRSTRQSRPQTAGRKASGSKKRFRPAAGVLQQQKNIRTLQPPKVAKLPAFYALERITSSNKKKLIPATGGAGMQAGKKKKRPMTAQTKQQKMFQQQMMQQAQHHFPHDLSPEEQQQLLQMQQQQQQHQDEEIIQEEEDDENKVEIEQQNEDGMNEQDEAQAQEQQMTYQLQEIPNFSEEYLQQLSEEQLELLLHQQQQLMLMQQQQRQLQQAPSTQKSNSRPKSGKQSAPKSMRPQSAKAPTVSAPGFNAYVQKNQKKISHPAVQQQKKKKKPKKQVAGVMMNNFFPALEGGDPAAVAALFPNKIDPRYPKFGLENLAKQAQAQAAQQNNPNMVVQDQIDEVPQEQEEAESQENIQTTHGLPNFYQPPQALAAVSTSGNKNNQMEDDEAQEEGDEDQDQADPAQQIQQDEGINQDSPNGAHQPAGIDLTDEQLVELIQNAHALSPDQQQQLQLILQQRMKMEIANERAQSYQNIYDILMDNVRRAKDRLAPLGQVSITHSHGGAHGIDSEETDRRILRQKQEFETLYRQYQLELKAKEQKKRDEDAQVEKRLQRESRIQAIREKKFQEELLSHQKSLNYKRNAQQVMLCQKVYKLASDLEKNKLLQEKREFKENQEKKKLQNKLMVDAIETYYKNQVQLLKERIESERFERRVAQQAQQQALNRMKKELADQKKKEVDRYLQLLKQEDSRYEFESSNIGKIENEIIKMYKKGK